MQLAEKGLLGIDDPVRKYLPKLPALTEAVTIHHCLTHTSGLPPLPDDPALAEETGKVHPLSAALVSYKDRSLLFTPGQRFEYSNAGFTVLGAIIERISRQSYETYRSPGSLARSTDMSRTGMVAGCPAS